MIAMTTRSSMSVKPRRRHGSVMVVILRNPIGT